MAALRLLGFTVLAAFALSAKAQDISGTIQIERKLTKRSVTAAVPVYQRGQVVQLATQKETDPLAFERSRVIIYLEGPGPAEAPANPAVLPMRQIDRNFSPDLLVVPVGSTVSFPNMDPIFHNIFSLSKPKSFDLGSYDKGATRSVTFPNSGIVYVNCHLHPNMSATIVITPNRWYAQADGAGKFRIPKVPPGQYTVVAWHKAAGFFRKPLTVEPGQDAVINFFLPLKDDHQPDTPALDHLPVAAGSR